MAGGQDYTNDSIYGDLYAYLLNTDSWVQRYISLKRYSWYEEMR